MSELNPYDLAGMRKAAEERRLKRVREVAERSEVVSAEDDPLNRPDWIDWPCQPNPIVSRVCEKGTLGCNVKHKVESVDGGARPVHDEYCFCVKCQTVEEAARKIAERFVPDFDFKNDQPKIKEAAEAITKLVQMVATDGGARPEDGAGQPTDLKRELELSISALTTPYNYLSSCPETQAQQCATCVGETIESLEALSARVARPEGEIERLPNELRGIADNAYCDYIAQMKRDLCLGWEQKVKEGVFGKAEIDAHIEAAVQLGRHYGLAEAARDLRTALDRKKGRGSDDSNNRKCE
jgi:hypothetical protein